MKKKASALSSQSYSQQLSFFSLFFSLDFLSFFSELLLLFSVMPGLLLILVENKIIPELCDYFHVTHMTYDFEIERTPWMTQGTPRKDLPPRLPHEEGCLSPAHMIFWKKGETTPPCATPKGSASPETLRGWSRYRS